MRLCETCQWWEPLRDGDEIGWCRRRTPITVGQSVVGEWPTTYCDDWCGEHRARDCDPVVGGKTERRG